MRTNTLQCEDCKHELMEHDPAADSAGGQEKMQAFNIATQPIRDALKRLDGMTLPSFNIMAWIAQNVVTEVVGVERADGEEQKVQVVIGGEEKDLLEKERLQEAQRYVLIGGLQANETALIKRQSAKRLADLAHPFDRDWVRHDTRSCRSGSASSSKRYGPEACWRRRR